VRPEHLNDDRLGRVLDGLYLSGLSALFVSICSVAVEGEYLESERVGSAAPVPIHITYGYSRDQRADLKQFVMNLVCWGDGDIPAFLELADGNQSDKTRFAAVLQAFNQFLRQH
jgi:transposase